MQTVIYADILIALNCIITFIILLTTADIIRTDSAAIRYMTGSLAGGFFSLIILAPEMNLFLVAISRFFICIVIVMISFPIKSLRMAIKAVCGFSVISFLYAGIVYFLSQMFLSDYLVVNNGYAYFDMSALTLIFLVSVVFIVIRLVNKYILSVNKKDYIYDAELSVNGKVIRIKALYDSGNSVKDIYSGKPVIIVSYLALKEAFTDEQQEKIRKILYENEYSDMMNGMRLLPVRTIGEQKLLPSFSGEKLLIRDETTVRNINKPCVALSCDSFPQERYTALINDSVLGRVV